MTYLTEELYGRINAIYLLEKANLAVTLTNQKNIAVAHAAFLDYPNWNIVDDAHWVSYIQSIYDLDKCTPLNTLFMHLFVASDECAVDSSHEIMRTVFQTVPELHFILLFIPTPNNLGTDLSSSFEQVSVLRHPSVVEIDMYHLFVCHRHRYCAQLYIRIARVEDNDDLTPLFTSQNDTLKRTYGDYFLAELIEAQDEDNICVVCEDEGKAVGFMSVCSKVNMKLLHDCFDLGPFHGFCKPHPDDILKPILLTPSAVIIETDEAVLEDENLISSSDLQLGSNIGMEESRTDEQPSKITHKAEASDVPITKSLGSKSKSFFTKTAPSTSETFTGSIVWKVSQASQLDSRGYSTPSFPTSWEEEIDESKSAETLSSHIPDRDIFHPVYKGEINAFCIQLFCIDEKHETRSLDFMKFVFGLFPDRDFCIISVPHLVPEFHLIQNFVRIIPFSNCILDHELYAFNRSGLLKSFVVRPSKSSDCHGVKVLIQTLDLNISIFDDLNKYILARRDEDGTPVQSFVAEVLGQIVGIAVIRNEMDMEYIRSHYNIEDFVYFSYHQQEEHGHLYHFVLNPIFHHYAKHFMKEILRLSYKNCLYYPIYPQHKGGKFLNPCAHSLTSALHYMVPVRPRRQIVYPLEKLGINAPSKQVSKDQAKYALYHFNRKLSLEPKVSVNIRIVVVGASNVGISFLETLVFCPHLKFNNLTLISTHGLPGRKASHNLHKHFLMSSHCFNTDDFALLSLASWVNVVVGKMTGIDRSSKHVIVSKDRKVPYDHLILCTGQQYRAPCPSDADIKELVTNREILNTDQKRYLGPIPCNLFTVCDDSDALIAVKWLKEKVTSSKANVIVYGNTVDVYTTVEALLSLGILGSNIYIVHPPLNSNITCLNNNAIERAVQKALARVGVSVHSDSVLAQWNDGDYPDPIQYASFTTNTKPFRLQCSAFLNFTNKGVDYDTFKAVNDACLVYDGKLVIDTNFHTNDVCIRAAGPLTKFSNIYYANEWTHSNFNSKEVGFQLAATMLNLFDPTLEPIFELPDDMDRLIPIYKGCKAQGGILPGKYNYIHIYKPGIPTRLDVTESQPNYGLAITTGDAGKGNYFRIHVNQYSLIETITCFSKEPIPVSNYICLFGQHERLLNNLCSRWREGLVTNLYSFFMEPWALVIFHDRFIELKKELRQILISAKEEGVPSMQELVRQVVEGEISLLERPKTYLKKSYKQSAYKNMLEKSILNYLHYNKYHLPMFAWPGII